MPFAAVPDYKKMLGSSVDQVESTLGQLPNIQDMNLHITSTMATVVNKLFGAAADQTVLGRVEALNAKTQGDVSAANEEVFAQRPDLVPQQASRLNAAGLKAHSASVIGDKASVTPITQQLKSDNKNKKPSGPTFS